MTSQRRSYEQGHKPKCLVEAGLEGDHFAKIEEIKKKLGAKICEEAGRLGIIGSTPTDE